MRVLVVTMPFADYAKGHVITEADEQERIAESHPGHVVAAEHPDPH